MLQVGKNAYFDVSEADSLVNELYDSSDDEFILWSSLDNNSKERLILKGTRLIESCSFRGFRYPGLYCMKWPRIIDFLPYCVPEDVKRAIIVQVLKEKLQTATKEHHFQELGIASYKVKDASVSFKDNPYNYKLNNGIFDSVWNEFLVHWCN